MFCRILRFFLMRIFLVISIAVPDILHNRSYFTRFSDKMMVQITHYDTVFGWLKHGKIRYELAFSYAFRAQTSYFTIHSASPGVCISVAHA